MTTQSTHPYSRLPKQTAGWDRIGDDDEIYIQSDDHRSSSWATTSKLPPPPPPPSHRMDYSDHEHSSSQQPRKRKRIAAPYQSTSRVNKSNDIPSTSQYSSSSLESRRPAPQRSNVSNPSRQVERPAPTKSWKYDAEGCANCRIHQSTCWWKKNRLVTNLNGVESWEEEKLCNTCSIHWNKNGYHRTVRSKPNKRSERVQPSQPDTFTLSSSQPSNSLARISSASRGSTVGLSSPSVSLAKLPSVPPKLVPRRRARSPSQLTRAAEREARTLKRTLAGKTDQTRLDVPDRRDPTQKLSNSAAAIFHPPAKAPLTKQYEDVSCRKSITDVGGYEVTEQMVDEFLAQSIPSLDAKTSQAPSEADLFSEFIFDSPTEQSHQPLSSLNFSEAFEPTRPPLSDHPFSSSFAPKSSPPRTPPSKRKTPAKSHGLRHHASKAAPSPTASPSFDLDYLLSPSFLNASPNSLLKKLIPSGPASDEVNVKTAAPGSGASLPGSDLFGRSDKIFLSPVAGQPNSDTLLPPSPTNPEPSKSSSKGSKWRGIGKNLSTTFLGDLHLTPSSSNSNKSSIFPGSELLSLNTNKSENRISPIMKKLSNSEKGIDDSETHPTSPTELVTRKLPPRKTKKPIITEDNPACASVALAQQLRSKSTFPNNSRFFEKCATAGSDRNETDGRTGSLGKFRSPRRPSKNLMARTIWSRRPTSSGPFSSEVPYDYEQGHFQSQIRSSPAQSENKSDRMVCSGSSGRFNVSDNRRTGMSSVMRHGLQFNYPIETNINSERTGVDRSSPPVLPPPSDCSEGIVSHSPGLFSDEDDDSPEETKETENVDRRLSRRPVAGTSTSFPSMPGLHTNGSEPMRKSMIKSDLLTPTGTQHQERVTGGGGGGLALKDITRSLNEPEGSRPSHQGKPSLQQVAPKRTEGQLQGLSPEILSAFREAIKAGWTPEDLARALKTFETPKPQGEGGIEKDG